MSPAQDILTKIIGIGIALVGLGYFLFAASDGAMSWLWTRVLGVLVLAIGVGFFRRKGWAFMFFSAGLLFAWMYYFIEFVRGCCLPDRSATAPLIGLLISMVLIAICGRWSMERHFRPHLEH